MNNIKPHWEIKRNPALLKSHFFLVNISKQVRIIICFSAFWQVLYKAINKQTFVLTVSKWALTATRFFNASLKKLRWVSELQIVFNNNNHTFDLVLNWSFALLIFHLFCLEENGHSGPTEMQPILFAQSISTNDYREGKKQINPYRNTRLCHWMINTERPDNAESWNHWNTNFIAYKNIPIKKKDCSPCYVVVPSRFSDSLSLSCNINHAHTYTNIRCFQGYVKDPVCQIRCCVRHFPFFLIPASLRL